MFNINGKLKGSLVIVLCVLIGYTVYTLNSRINAFDARVTNLENRLDKAHEAEVELLEELRELNYKTDEIKKLEEKNQKAIKSHEEALNEAKNGISIHTDLEGGKKIALNASDINRIIDGWTKHIKNDSVLKGHGEAFIRASRETGLDPVYLLAHAIVESGCGTSYLAVNRNNFFGINAVDNNPNLASRMGDSVDQGIIAGAHWIKSNFYDNGYTSLYAMSSGGYASNPRWASDIASVYNDAIDYL